MADRTLSHFACFRLGEAFWGLHGDERGELLDRLVTELGGVADRVEVYQVYPTRSDADLLVWSAVAAEDPDAPARLFRGFARALAPHRARLEPSHTFWGLTRPSPYTGRGGSSREIEAVGGERLPYLVVYPFSKTAPWYLLPDEERREMMAEHIRVGRRHEGVRQLLLYSFGLQDQEFVVVYETGDLGAFSDLVYELRSTEARAYTALDTPVLTAVRQPPEEREAEPGLPWLLRPPKL